MRFPRLMAAFAIASIAYPAVQRTSGFDAVSRRAAAAREASRLDEAASLYRQAVRLKPSWMEGWWYLGTIQYEKDRWQPARDAFAHVVKLDPKAGPALAMLGLCEFRLGNHEIARVALGRARELGYGTNDQLRRVATYHLGLLENRAGQPEVALRTLKPLAKEALAGAPDLLEAFGVAALRRVIFPDDIPASQRDLFQLAGRAQAALSALNWPDARDALATLAAAYPRERGVHYLAGTFLLIREPDQALLEFRKEIEIAPGDVPARLQIAFELLRRGDYSAALPYAEDAVKRDPKNFPARNALGRVLLALDQVNRAITELEYGVKLAPESPEMQFALAQAYSRAGRMQEAERARAEFRRLDQQRTAAKKSDLRIQ